MITKGEYVVYKEPLMSEACALDIKHTARDKVYKEVALVFRKEDAEFLALVANQCQAINPAHPKKVAENIEKMYEALKTIWAITAPQYHEKNSKEINKICGDLLLLAEIEGK